MRDLKSNTILAKLYAKVDWSCVQPTTYELLKMLMMKHKVPPEEQVQMRYVGRDDDYYMHCSGPPEVLGYYMSQVLFLIMDYISLSYQASVLKYVIVFFSD